ncbi:urease accessory protein UreD [Chthonobacter albigriseus]|uniref:urease accessory protein UreD n=1 Tax=Chthonobacter albigriseus TaxID=1683161 RepID=UPI0019D5AE77|nr:urease accessory protein UreD [Chthonobacter albigriseus]
MNAVLPIAAEVPMPIVRMQRARGIARVSFKQAAGRTRLDGLFQEGSCKVRLPRVHDGRGPMAVFINTAGGITGGDEITLEAAWGEGTRATVTSQAAERIYKRSDGAGTILNRLTVGAGADALWLPQETIVFDRAALSRRLEVDLASTARFTGVEAIVLGRTAMGEDVLATEVADHWRVRRGGRLVYADSLRLVGDTRAILSGGATGRGARAFATVLHVADDAEARVETLRDLLDGAEGVEAGVSGFDGMAVVRLIADDGRRLRTALETVIVDLSGGPVPRVWSI